MLATSAPRLDRRTLALGAFTAVLPLAEEVLLAQIARALLAETMVAEVAGTLSPTHSREYRTACAVRTAFELACLPL